MDAKTGGNVVKVLARKAALEIVKENPLYNSLQTITDCPQREEDRKRAEAIIDRIAKTIERTFHGE